MKEAIIAISDDELLLQVAYDGIGTRSGTENSNNFEKL